jgi:hypothetical protein
MEKQLLCSECRPQGNCLFVEEVNKAMTDLPPFEEQKPIAPGTKITEEALGANNQIAEMRIRAREIMNCPQVNYNPQNPNFQPNL